MKCPHCDGKGELSNDDITPGAIILSYRKRQKMTQQDLASKVGLSRAQIANIEVNRSDITLRGLKAFANAFGIQMKDLVP